MTRSVKCIKKKLRKEKERVLGTRTTKSNGEDEKSSGDMPWPQELTAGGGAISVSVVGERKVPSTGWKCVGRSKEM